MTQKLEAQLLEKPKDKPLKKVVRKLRKDLLPRLLKYKQYQVLLGDRNSFSKTDPDATFMRMKEDHMRNGQLKPGWKRHRQTIPVDSRRPWIHPFVFRPIYCPAITAPPVARAANKLMSNAITKSTKDTAETADSLTCATMIESTSPTEILKTAR